VGFEFECGPGGQFFYIVKCLDSFPLKNLKKCSDSLPFLPRLSAPTTPPRKAQFFGHWSLDCD